MEQIRLSGAILRNEVYNNGMVLLEVANMTTAFKFLGQHYTSAKGRANKGKPYSFKQITWRGLPHAGVFYKLALIVMRRVYRIK